MTKKSKIEIIISSLIIISSAFIIFIFNNQQQKIDNQTRVAKTELRKKKKELKAIPNEVQKKLEEANPDSSNLIRALN